MSKSLTDDLGIHTLAQHNSGMGVPEVMSYLGGEAEISMDVTISFLAYNYNQPVTFVLPQEAEEL